LLGLSATMRRLFLLPAHLARMLPLLALLPLFNFWFGASDRGAIVFVAFGAFTIVFRQGKAQVKMYGDGDEELECWLSGKKIILRKPGAPNEDMPIEINDDGTLDTPMGEVKRKSSS